MVAKKGARQDGVPSAGFPKICVKCGLPFPAVSIRTKYCNACVEPSKKRREKRG